MPKTTPQQSTPHICKHTTLRLEPSPHAAIANYKRLTAKQRAAATTHSGHVRAAQDIQIPGPGTFPAPLVLPDDDLALDPTYPAQSFRSWLRDKDRNKITPERCTIYIARPPGVDPDIAFVKGWGKPRIAIGKGKGEEEADVPPPDMDTVVRYLEAFYHGLPVKLLPSSALKFAAWDDDDNASPESVPKPAKPSTARAPSKAPMPARIALQTPTEAIGIRARPCPVSSPYPAQLHLDDVLDVAIAILPTDAYSLLLLVEQDLYEDEDDEFVCGRAYGGSRVAVVSTAQYHPALDSLRVDRQHAWPGSHCEEYVLGCCASAAAAAAAARPSRQRRGGKSQDRDAVESGSDSSSSAIDPARIFPMRAALSATLSLPALSDSVALSNLWLSRVCKTASHELGHCLGIDHCVYYACIMQGSASIAEDARQPPFLCPVEEAKLGWAVAELAGKELGKGGEGDAWREEWGRERTGRLREFCGEVGWETGLWRAYGAWLGELEGRRGGRDGDKGL